MISADWGFSSKSSANQEGQVPCTTVALPQNEVGALRPLYASRTDSLGKPPQSSGLEAAFRGERVPQNGKCNCSTCEPTVASVGMLVAYCGHSVQSSAENQLNRTPNRPPVSVASVSFVSSTKVSILKSARKPSLGKASEFMVTMYWKPASRARSAPSCSAFAI